MPAAKNANQWPEMATERQIAANRRNALKSTGPRSSAGKKRASRNTSRHGFSIAATTNSEFAKQVEDLARGIAGAGSEPLVLEHARSIAHAQLDLEQIRRMKVSLLQRIHELGALDVPEPTIPDIIRTLDQHYRGRPSYLRVPQVKSMPSSEPERMTETIRRALPELIKLERYERCAAARRNRATLRMAATRAITAQEL
jgi:hypothetical protein